jgi:uncharacterized protein (TIGR02597 family)
MKANKLALFSFGLSLLSAGAANGQTATTDPVGFVTVNVKANSDATIAVPLNRSALFKGVIQSISGTTITVAGTSPAWQTSPMQFVQSIPTQVSTYAVKLATGAKEGMIGKITANGTNTITIQLDAGDDLSGVKTEAVDGVGLGDHIDILAYWTPASLLSVVPPVGFSIAGFENPGAGINFGSSELYAHAGSNSWEDGINGGDSTHSPLRFGAALIARNSSGADYSATFVGAVPMTTSRIRISTLASNTAQDQYIGYMAPVPEPIATPTNPNALGFPVQTGDSIQGFDNSISGFNQGSAEYYVWNGAAWEDGINGGEIHTTAVTLKPGFGYIFQKAPTPTPTSVVWVRVPGYLAP